MKMRYSEQQISDFLKEAEAGIPVKELCRRHEFSEASYHHWRNKFGDMEVSEANRLKALEAENAWLKRLLAESLLQNEVTREALRKLVTTPAQWTTRCDSSTYRFLSSVIISWSSNP